MWCHPLGQWCAPLPFAFKGEREKVSAVFCLSLVWVTISLHVPVPCRFSTFFRFSISFLVFHKKFFLLCSVTPSGVLLCLLTSAPKFELRSAGLGDKPTATGQSLRAPRLLYARKSGLRVLWGLVLPSWFVANESGRRVRQTSRADESA